MSRQTNAWKNGVIGLVIVAALIGAFWHGGKKDRSDQSAQASSSTQVQKPKINQTPAQEEPGLQKGDRAPVFALPTLDGHKMDLSKRNGKPALINFWATWCPPCREEMPTLQSIYQQYKNRVDFFIVNSTYQEGSEADVSGFLKQYGLTFPVLKDKTGEVTEKYVALGLPTTYIVDAKGVIVWKKTGPVTSQEVKRVLDSLTRPEG
ncbi:hypothetical protein JIR001_14210 [Polycladomyces abyssicola]|uniref:Thioredoxin domain-containing protein n=1 Tax=Polycladomyces abyssicola TaxID=1125966 RepID=A0A8D5UG91_9BACL|nr:TlpA disulfide reductase family protein [Polycladomyces abyssicola]BCU81638.1 hypothetical protein JIR001_14210 [Polycladomyces abyssicola]